MTEELGRRFREACGLTGPLSLRLRGPGGAEVLRSLDAPFAVVGRNAAADLVLDDPLVSRRHAYLQVLDGRPFLIDLESRTGLRWSGGVVPWGWLGSETGLGLGSWQIALGPGPEPPEPRARLAWPSNLVNPLSSRPREHGELSPVTLAFPDLALPLWPMRSVLVLIGRSENCRVRIDAKEVSRYHSALVRTPTGPWVVGLLGRGRLTVNGRDVRLAPLADGDVLGVEDHRIHLHLAQIERLEASGRALALPRRGPSSMVVRPSVIGPSELLGTGTGSDSLLAQVAAQFGMMQQQMFEQFQEAMASMGQLFGNLHRQQMELVRAELDELRRLNRDLIGLQGQLGIRQTRQPDSSSAGTRPATPESPREPAERPSPRPARHPGPSASESSTPPDPALHAHLARRIAGLKREQQTRWQRILELIRDPSS